MDPAAIHVRDGMGHDRMRESRNDALVESTVGTSSVENSTSIFGYFQLGGDHGSHSIVSKLTVQS